MCHKMTCSGKNCPGKFTYGICELTTDVAKHQNVHIDQNLSRIKFNFIPVHFELRRVVSLRSNSYDISMDESLDGVVCELPRDQE